MLILVFGISAIAWFMSIEYPFQKKVTQQALISDDQIAVKTSPWLSFIPRNKAPEVGIIFYPGGKTSPETFAPILREYAEHGLLAVITPMPFNTAFLGINNADDVIAYYPRVTTWFIAGHSLGGVAASVYMKKADTSKVKGLLLWASYPATDISDLKIKVLSVSGLEDRGATPEKIALHKKLLPSNTKYVAIGGANHWQFGFFQPKKARQKEIISASEQQNRVFEATYRFINSILR